jgi:hypothetical protein
MICQKLGKEGLPDGLFPFQKLQFWFYKLGFDLKIILNGGIRSVLVYFYLFLKWGFFKNVHNK